MLLRLLGVALAGFAAIDVQLAAGAEILVAGIVAGDRSVEIVVGAVAVEAAVGLTGVDIQLLIAAAGDIQRLGQADIAGNVAADILVTAEIAQAGLLHIGTEGVVGVDARVRHVDLADVVDAGDLGNAVAGQIRDSVTQTGMSRCAKQVHPVGIGCHRFNHHPRCRQRGREIHHSLRGFLRGHRTNPSPLGA